MVTEFTRALMEICIELRVMFFWRVGVFVIPVDKLELVLKALPATATVFGIGTFSLVGNGIQPHMAEEIDFDKGVSPPKAVELVASWSADPDRWVEITGALQSEDGSRGSN